MGDSPNQSGGDAYRPQLRPGSIVKLNERLRVSERCCVVRMSVCGNRDAYSTWWEKKFLSHATPILVITTPCRAEDGRIWGKRERTPSLRSGGGGKLGLWHL